MLALVPNLLGELRLGTGVLTCTVAEQLEQQGLYPPEEMTKRWQWQAVYILNLELTFLLTSYEAQRARQRLYKQIAAFFKGVT